MGYVYYQDIWGGHAWVEVYAGGRWMPLDATVYYPGSADPARIGADTETGASGTLSGAGELARLYGKVDVRTLAISRSGATTEVAPGEVDHQVRGATYRNAWLGLTVTRPEDLAFADLDAHWPSNAVLSMKGPAGQVSVRLLTASPDRTVEEQVKSVLADVPGGDRYGAPQAVTWDGRAAVRISSQDGSAIAAMKDDQLWMVFAIGPGSQDLLDRALPGISIADLKD